MQQWLAEAPANIALIKYMGKKNKDKKIPANPSLSYTLNHLRSYVSLEFSSDKHDTWELLELPGLDNNFSLSASEQQRFLGHLAFLKEQFSYRGGLVVRSVNNFPHSTGLASSASSFAALTKCALLALSELTDTPELSIEDQAKLSRHGSGSSCRSFFSPWALWDGEKVSAIDIPYDNLIHEVIIISHAPKVVSSSKAHELVETSPLYLSRIENATHNLHALLEAFRANKWADAYSICWREFQEMHALFSTSQQPFGYMTPDTHQILDRLHEEWKQTGDGPIVTMDAGPNIHLLYRSDQAEQARLFKQDVLIGNFDVL